MHKNQKGFTLFEIIIVVFILSVLALISIPAYNILLRSFEVEGNMQEFYIALKLAQTKTLSSENDSQYGVYINTAITPNQYIIYKGASYATRDTAYDQLYWLHKNVEFSSVSLGGGYEVLFQKLTGYALDMSGSVVIRSKVDTSKSKTVYISSSGIMSFVAPVAITDARVKDSRHVHFDYSRIIDTNAESITLLFDGTIPKVIPIVSNMFGGQIDWTGTVLAGGSDQTVSVRTHRLNNSGTQFSIHRSGDLNNKTLVVTISGDTSGNLVQYSANGLTTTTSSIFVSNFAWQ